MKVRCIKILEGGRREGRELTESSSIHIGGEYVVLGISARPIDGASYLLLRDGSETQTAVWIAEMFEITSDRIPASWRVRAPYSNGVLINFQPEAWFEPEFWQRKERGEREASEVFRREVRGLVQEESALADE